MFMGRKTPPRGAEISSKRERSERLLQSERERCSYEGERKVAYHLSADLMTKILKAKIWQPLNIKSDCEVLTIYFMFYSCLVK